MLEKQLKEKDKEIEKLENIINEIKNVVNNEKVSGIEAKLIIKDILNTQLWMEVYIYGSNRSYCGVWQIL